MHTVDKILESIIKDQLEEFINLHDLIPEKMHGCRKHHNVITAKLDIDEEINLHKDNGRKVAILSTDLSSAYDMVNHSLLLNP